MLSTTFLIVFKCAAIIYNFNLIISILLFKSRRLILSIDVFECVRNCFDTLLCNNHQVF